MVTATMWGLIVGVAVAGTTGVVPGPESRARWDVAAFRAPDSFHWPGYMWIWNDVLLPEVLKAQLADVKAHGALSPMPLPEPKEFRPTNMPTRMEPAYLTPEFFAVVGQVADEAARLGLRLWLYDEGGWPSGNACGQLVRAHPELGRQSLVREVVPIGKSGDAARIPPDCLAAFLASPDGLLRRLKPGDVLSGLPGGSRVLIFRVNRHHWHADLMNPAATDAFLAMTHEGYRRAAGRHFGTTIPAIFTDEPNMGDMPWTEGLAEAFKREKGYDLLERLPSLYEGDSRDDAQVRIDYFDWWSQRFATSFFRRCREWCRRYGILFAGHLNGEDETLGARKHGFGNAMRIMREMDIPGVDAIWRQLWPGKRNHHFPKLASSVAHQEGGGWAITESFAVYGSGLTPEQMKWILDYQFVRGINLLDMIGYPYSTADWMIGGERPNCHPKNPLWDALSDFHAYAARLSYLLSLGKPRIRTALYFPIRDIWAGGHDAEQAAATHDAIAQVLFENQCDFDLVDDEVLERATTRVERGHLVIGPMRYETVVVGRCAWMTDAARERLSELAAAGGKVLAVDMPASAVVPRGSRMVALKGLPEHLVPLARPSSPCPTLRVSVREARNGAVYFFTNEGLSELDATVTVPERGQCFRLNPETGEVLRTTGAKRTDSGTSLRLVLPFAGSAVGLFAKDDQATRAVSEPGAAVTELHGPWTLMPVRRFVLGDRDIEVEQCSSTPQRADLGDWRPFLGEAFSGDAVYECRFRVDAATARAAAWLDLGEVRYACRVELNGMDLGRRLWRPWRLAIQGALRVGENVLRVTVTNTLANQYVHNRSYEKWSPAQLGPYHPIALRFEPESLPSGLFGPVRLLSALP